MHNNETSKVSIIIPNYNRGHCIGRAIQSVIEQTFTNWELIVVDNHSTDNSLEVINSFNDSRITILKTRNNGIIAHSRNLGIKKARSDYIAFLDSDDWWLNNKLQISVACLDSGNDLVYHDLYKISRFPVNKNIKSIVPTRHLASPVIDDLLAKGNAINNSSVVVRRSLMKDINGFSEHPELVGSEDFDGWIRVAKLTEKFKRLNLVLGYYWDGGGNVSSFQTALSNNIFLSHRYKKELKILFGNKLPGWMLYSLARSSVALGKFTDGRRYSFLAIRSKLTYRVKIKAVTVWLFSMLKYRV